MAEAAANLPASGARAIERAGETALCPPPRAWRAALAVSLLLLLALVSAAGWVLAAGVGVWGIRSPVGWGFAIVSFVWWIGIAHAGTLISAILLLLRQQWRRSVSRFAETMTLAAITCAALFPLLHMGRPWLAYWLAPYPNTMGVWPQFRSPLVWDVFAIGCYLAVSAAYWYIGMLPDLALLRDRAAGRRAALVYGVLALGWRGSAYHWERHHAAQQLLAGLTTVLVVSVHSVVSFDFAVSLVPGWHSTVFPPYFVAGAIFSGFAMLLLLVIPVRRLYRLEELVTAAHLDNMAKVLLAAGLVVAYGYAAELFTAWYGGGVQETGLIEGRLRGETAPLFWLMILLNVALPQLLWLRRARRSAGFLLGVAAAVSAGMWIERYLIVVTSLETDYLPSAWGRFSPTAWDWTTLAGSGGLFLLLLVLFARYLPLIAVHEVAWPGGEVEGRA